jgi:hypothetical protein
MIIGMFPALSWIPQAHAQEECEPFGDSPMCVFLHPGIADDYKLGWSHTLDTLWGTQDGAGLPPPGTPGDNAQTRQVFDNYLDYAILASSSADNPTSIGDLQFDITLMDDVSAIELYLPPEFKFLAPTVQESIWTDITNDYSFIVTAPVNMYDPIAPGWTRIWIGVGPWGTGPYGPGFPSDTLGFLIEGGRTYHIRLFDLGAPAVAGLYHFKIYYWDALPLALDIHNPLLWNNLHSIGAGNFPFVIVKSELNPAWVEVTVRTELYFAEPFVSGHVLAEGTTPEGRAVTAQAYWGPMEFVQNLAVSDTFGNPGAEYRTYLFGVAEGTYTLKATASGMVPKTSDRFTVLAGQSYHAYISIFDSPDLYVTIWSKHGTGETPWHNLWQKPYGTNDPAADPCDAATTSCPRRDIMIDLYDSQGNLAGFWATDDINLRFDGTYRKWFGWANRLGWTGAFDPSGFPMFSLSAAPTPTSTNYIVHLVDNYDLLYNARGYPSTRWDGHVPWDTADYVDGVVNGQYSLEAFVTGYIMDEPDAYQRTFTVSGIDMSVQFDLRRSNWIETVMHLPSGLVLSDTTTVVLTADDANGNERASVAFFAYPEFCDDGVIDGSDVSADASYTGGIVIEGKNAIFPNIGSTTGRGTSRARQLTEKDYGLNPTPSSHSAGEVPLAGNPYTVKLWMADMGSPWLGPDFVGTGWYSILGGDPQVSVFLCNSRQTLSFTIVNSWVWISLRSVDFEIPAHSRPWTFPGSEIWVDFKDENGDVADTLDPTVYGFFQDAGMTCTAPITGSASGAEPPFPIVGNDVSCGVTPYDIDNVNEAGMHEHVGIRYAGTDWTSPSSLNTYSLYRALPNGGLRPTRLLPGQYTMEAHTHGYIMRRAFSVQVPGSGGADIEADMIQGAAIRVVIDFKHEGVHTGFNGFIRVEVLNEAGELVGASIYGQAEPNLFTQSGAGGAYFPYAGWGDHKLVAGPAQGAGYGPSAAPSPVFPSESRPQRALFSNLYYRVPETTWATWDYMTPSDANRVEIPAGEAEAVDVYGFYYYAGDPTRTWAGGWPTTNAAGYLDSGLKGSNDIPGWSGSGGGKYTIKVWAFDPYGPDGLFEAAAPSDDWRMYQMGWPLENIELPWGGAQDHFITMNAMATLTGTVQWLDMFGNLKALPWAQVTASPGSAFDSHPAYATGLGAVGAGASDSAGAYIMWLPAGSHDVSVSTSEASQVWGSSAPTMNAQYTVFVSDGWVGGGDTRLAYEEGVPVPELPSFALPLSLFAVLAASVWLLRKRTLNVPVLMK